MSDMLFRISYFLLLILNRSVLGSFNQEMIDKAHEHGILCNVFWSDGPEETKRYLDMGIDVILSNNYLQIANTVKEWKENKK